MRTEYDDRLQALRTSIRAAEMDAFLVTSTDSVYYLTGLRYEPFERVFFLIVRAEGEVQIVTPRIEAENMATIPLPHRITEYADFPARDGETHLDALAEVLDADDHIGVEPTIEAELLATLAPWGPSIAPLVERLRLVKSRHEIACISRAAIYSDLGLRMVMEAAKSGTSVQSGYDCIPGLRDAIIRGEGRLDQYTSSIWLGAWAPPFSAQPHRFPEPSDMYGAGPIVGLSFLRVNGYSAETERTFFLEPPTAEEAEVFQTMLAACAIAYDRLAPGVSAHEVDHAVMTFLRAEGFGDNLLHRTGHGIGMGGHEGPWVAEGSQDVLRENMVISIEPGIYWRGRGGYRHSDTVLITADGYRKLTDFPDDLSAMTLG